MNMMSRIRLTIRGIFIGNYEEDGNEKRKTSCVTIVSDTWM
jgi:hypothetical protein